MSKKISKLTGILLIIIAAGVVGIAITFINQKNLQEISFDNSTVENELEFSEKEKLETEKEKLKVIGDFVKDFMEESYIRKNYKNASRLFIPPKGFERSLSVDPMSAEDYISWFVESVGLDNYNEDGVYSVRIIDVRNFDEKEELGTCSSLDENNEEMGVDFFTVTFQFIKENGEALYFGPCCGSDEPPFSDWFSCVKSTNNGYMIYKDLPYLP